MKVYNIINKICKNQLLRTRIMYYFAFVLPDNKLADINRLGNDSELDLIVDDFCSKYYYCSCNINHDYLIIDYTNERLKKNIIKDFYHRYSCSFERNHYRKEIIEMTVKNDIPKEIAYIILSFFRKYVY